MMAFIDDHHAVIFDKILCFAFGYSRLYNSNIDDPVQSIFLSADYSYRRPCNTASALFRHFRRSDNKA